VSSVRQLSILVLRLVLHSLPDLRSLCEVGSEEGSSTSEVGFDLDSDLDSDFDFDLDLQTFRPSDFQTFRPSDLQTFRPSDCAGEVFFREN
jgi:hypothetical protein